MARHSALRASDADREAVAGRLRQAVVEGRLEPWEFEARVGRALAARTYGELDRVLRDLPGRRTGTPALALAVRLIVVLAVVTAAVAAAALVAAWWLLCAIVWLTVRGGRRLRRPPSRGSMAYPSW